MLYAENNTDLTLVSAALKLFDMPEEYIDICIRYMSGETADGSLLDGLKPFALGKTKTAEKAVGMDSLRNKLLDKDNELYARFTNFAFAACGISGAEFVNSMYEYGNAVRTESRVSALERRYPDEAAAIELAMRAYYYIEVWQRTGNLYEKDPELCIKAIDMLEKYDSGKDHFIVKAALCALALDNTPLPSQSPDAASLPRVKKAGECLKEIYKKIVRTDEFGYGVLSVGFAEAACFDKLSEKIFGKLAENRVILIAKSAEAMNIDCLRVLNVIESVPEVIKPDYIRYIAASHYSGRGRRLAALAKQHTDMMKTVLETTSDLRLANELNKILAENVPGYSAEKFDLKGKVQKTVLERLDICVKDPGAVRRYMNGEGDYAEMKASVKGRIVCDLAGGSAKLNYYGVFGADDFFKRLLALVMNAEKRSYYFSDHVFNNTGFAPLSEDKNDLTHEEKTLEFLLEAGAPIGDALSGIGLVIDGTYFYHKSDIDAHIFRTAKAAGKYPELLEKCSAKDMSAMGRVILARAFSEDPMRFRPQIAALAEDGSKQVRQEIVGIYKEHRELADEVTALLKAKKQSKREAAVTVLEAWGAEGFEQQLGAALDAEKNDKLKLRIAALLGSEQAQAAVEVSTEERIRKLMRGSAKLAWLYTKPFEPVHKTDGTEAEEDLLKAMMLCYAGMDRLGRSSLACEIAEGLDTAELEVFAQEVFSRWFGKGAEAKTKWVLYFSAVHGGMAMVSRLVEHINEWGAYSFNMRTAIAGEAVKAIAMNGSSEALMTVDHIAHKFKGKSVRAAANEAMASAADGLGITAEELLDRIVPDLGFDEKLCRVFDYGSRQFSVYIRPSLELEIFCGDKQIKSLPKPGASDDAEKAAAAYDEFKDMKKQMKAAVTAQKKRLEYVLMCDRKWNTEGWRTLFVRNAIMHCFAIGLIWGVYENGKLAETFRYMEDGSFTTCEGDEYELPENAEIGLVHPIELSDEQREEWLTQLDDFEIVQPFPQLSRRIYKPAGGEADVRRSKLFDGCEINSLSLVGKMTRLGWDKGSAEDAGMFYYFYRQDYASRSVDKDGNVCVTGYGAMLTHSGTYIAVNGMDEETITAGDLIFFKAGHIPGYWDKEGKEYIPCGDVSPRYYSEIVLQLTSVLGAKGE